MAKAAQKSKTKAKSKKAGSGRKPAKKTESALKGTLLRPVRLVWYYLVRVLAVLFALTLFLVVLFAFVNPPTTQTMWSESRRLGQVKQEWVALENIAPVMARSVVAAEDSNFCLHWGFDVAAIRAAIADGHRRGGSTITQQVVKNVYLWQGRSWIRKALEAAITPMVEIVWTKRRIIEVYLNVAELDEGVFGVAAAAPHYFGVQADKLSANQAAALAAVLPSPKTRSAKRPSASLRRKATKIADGAATIRADGRAACFED